MNGNNFLRVVLSKFSILLDGCFLEEVRYMDQASRTVLMRLRIGYFCYILGGIDKE